MEFKNSPTTMRDYTHPETGAVILRVIQRKLKRTLVVDFGGHERFIKSRIYRPARHD